MILPNPGNDHLWRMPDQSVCDQVPEIGEYFGPARAFILCLSFSAHAGLEQTGSAMLYRPFVGSGFADSRFLIVSESAYSWIEGGELKHPPETQPSDTVDHAIKRFDGREDDFARRMTMAVTGRRDPDEHQRRLAWNRYAYTIYVQGTVGDAPRQRPIREMYEHAKEPFLALLEKQQPRRILVVGLDAWKYMPDADAFLVRDLQAYKLKSGALAWCMAVGHTAGSEWPGWEALHKAMTISRGLNLPERSLS